MKYLLILLILCSCSANSKLRRAERLIKQAEASGLQWRVDTVYTEIPVIIDSIRVDSIFVAQVGDTVVIEKERLKLRYVRLPGDSVYIEAECKADTIFQKVPVTVTKTIQAKTNWWLYFFVGFGACLLVVVVVGKLRS
jgi:hypothetical protein